MTQAEQFANEFKALLDRYKSTVYESRNYEDEGEISYTYSIQFPDHSSLEADEVLTTIQQYPQKLG